MRSQTKAWILAAAGSILASVACAEDFYVVAPATRGAEFETERDAVQAIFKNHLKPGDSFHLIDATLGKSVASARYPTNARFSQYRFRQQEFPEPDQRIRNFYLNAAKAKPTAAEVDASNIPGVLETLAAARKPGDAPAHVIIFGSPFYRTPTDPSAAMIDAQGRVVLPSDTLLLGPNSLSPFGRSPGSGKRLTDVTIHFCPRMPEGTSLAREQAIGRVWAKMIQLDGGTLATFTGDINGCIARYARKAADAIPIGAWEKTAPKAMLALRDDGQLQRLVVDTRGGAKPIARLVEDIDKIASLEREAATSSSAASRLKQENATLSASLSSCTRESAKKDAALKAFKMLVEKPDKFAGLRTINTFDSVPHLSKPNLTVITGVAYDRDRFPRWDHAWCYLALSSRVGSPLNLTVATKSPGNDVVPSKTNFLVLADANINRETFETARQSCRFPKN